MAQIAAERRDPLRLPELNLPAAVEVTGDDAAGLTDASVVVSAVPTQHLRETWTRLSPWLEAGVPVVSVSKGIEIDTLLRPTQVIAAATGDDPAAPSRPLGALSGPTIAAELARHLPATMVAASRDDALCAAVQSLFGTDWLRIYRNRDLVGVEIAGAVKNVIALAAGMLDGLQAGYNAKSALLARGLAEIARLGSALGAAVETFFGVAGVGDLAVTCFSPQGRNRRCGERLGCGEPLQEVLGSMVAVVEGVPTTRAVRRLAEARGVDMPITQAVHAILFEGLRPADAIGQLMRRRPKSEGFF
jgi:glycerol-3-phosphate dehydrogenase (NAD(P)+)